VAKKLRKQSIHVGVIDIFRVKPINHDLLLAEISTAKNIICLEENLSSGGLNEKISSVLMRNNVPARFDVIAIPDSFCYSYGSRDYLHKKYKIDELSIIKKIKESFETKSKK